MRALLVVLALAACSRGKRDLESVRAHDAAANLQWEDVLAEIEEHVCIRTFETSRGPIEDPVFGAGERCELSPPTTALERAAERAWVEAGPILDAMRHAWEEPVRDAMGESSPKARLAAVRRAHLDGRFLGLLVAHLEPALAAEGLRCDDCPTAFVPAARTITWDELAPYLERYLWADPVETPRDAMGRPTGEPHYGMHVCIGTNGILELEDRDPALVELGFLATFHNDRLFDRVGAAFRELREDPVFTALQDDFVRTRWLRAELGPRVLAEPEMRASICATVARFVADTGIRVADCEASP